MLSVSLTFFVNNTIINISLNSLVYLSIKHILKTIKPNNLTVFIISNLVNYDFYLIFSLVLSC